MRCRVTSLVLMGAAVALAQPALAAGPEPVLAEPIVAAPVAPAPVTDWTGAYGGLSFGAAFGRSEAELGDYFGALIESDVERGLFPRDISDDSTGAMGGLSLGYNVQRGNLVGGIEFDISLLNQDTEAEFSRFDENPIFLTDTNTTYRTEISGLASLRLRAGFAQDRNLFFATAGVAAGRVENQFSLELPDPALVDPLNASWSEDGTRWGYIIGAGVERRLSDQLSVKGEFLYYDLEDSTVEARHELFPGQGIDYQFSNDGYLARVGVNFAF